MHMNLTCMISTLSILVSVIPSTMSNAADKITVSYSSRTYAFLPAQVAVAKGFFKDENLDPVLIQMRSQVTVPALLSGEVNYTLSFGNIIAGAMQGMPFKILAVLTDKPLHHIVARPEIKTIADLPANVAGLRGSAALTSLRLRRFFKPRGLISRRSSS
jgi:ABC-type nitrate/sulfonate/bicarbonate transport system substrate-binding protein